MNSSLHRFDLRIWLVTQHVENWYVVLCWPSIVARSEWDSEGRWSCVPGLRFSSDRVQLVFSPSTRQRRPSSRSIIPVIDDEDVFEHPLQLVACCCYVRVDRNLFDLGVAYGCSYCFSQRELDCGWEFLWFELEGPCFGACGWVMLELHSPDVVNRHSPYLLSIPIFPPPLPPILFEFEFQALAKSPVASPLIKILIPYAHMVGSGVDA